MKAVMLMFDSLNRHFLEPYGCDWTKTPNFSRLAEKTCKFNNFYVGSLPCMPARRELHTGRYNLLHRSWGPIEPFDISTPELLKKNGVYSHLITDHQHYWEDGGATYHNRYSSYEFVRGQEGDVWKGEVKDPEVPVHEGRLLRQDIINRKYIDCEEKQPQTLCFELGLDFLQKNKLDDNWLLQLETFDPHEPFYTMQKYKDLYPHDYDGPQYDWPDYRKVSETKDVVDHVRYEYAALLSMCDHNLGRILDFFDENNMWNDTMLIVNTDHGFLLGEHDCWAKCVHPFYNEVARIPFFIWDPRVKIKNEERNALAQTIDIAPTLLDFYNAEIPKEVQGRPLLETVKSDKKIHDAILFGIHGGQLNITDGRYLFMKSPNKNNSPLFNYTLMPTHMRDLFSDEELKTMEIANGFSFTNGNKVMKFDANLSKKQDLKLSSEIEHMLFDLHEDPQQLISIINNEVEERLSKEMVRLMKENDAPIEQYVRLELQKYT